MQNAEVPFAEHIDDLAREEIQSYIKTNSHTFDSYFLVDLDTAQKLLCMKQSTFYKYIRNRPEIRSIERYPVDPKTGITSSKKPYFKPEELKAAVNHIYENW